ncbi:MAG TPA: hypothetical protein VFX12_09350 [Vicinamibacterales bacterium]|nr:hypothetical protein [Vicinamibacterales bacterium]
MRTRISLAIALLAAGSMVVAAQSAPIQASRHNDPPPPDLAPAIAQQLASGGVRAVAGPLTLTFWWVKALPLGEGSGPAAWSAVPEGSLVGAVKLAGDGQDIRGRVVKAGVYTLRYGIQPANGDHLGVSPYRDFLLICPAALDKAAAPTGHDGAIDLSKQTIGGSHPAVWSLDPPETTEPLLSVHTTDLGHKSLIMEVPASRAGASAGALRFGLVLIGKIEA